MEGYNTESEQLAALHDWWKKNGRYVLAGIVAGALVVGGWRMWHYWEARRAADAANLYAALTQAEQQKNEGAVVNAAQAVISTYPDTAYGALAGLALAKAEFARNDVKAAEAALRNVIGNSSDGGLAAIARLRLARLQTNSGDAKGALATLTAMPERSDAFAASVDEVRGEALAALGQTAAARSAYEAALAKSGSGSGLTVLTRMRLASLPVAATSPAPAVTAVAPGAASVARAARTGAPAKASGKKGGKR